MLALSLMDNTGGIVNLVGEKQQGNGYSGFNNPNMTVNIQVVNFTGRVKIQASLVSDPSDNDWFDILLDGNAYVQYPQIPTRPTGNPFGDTSSLGFTFSGNYTWLRAVMDRSYITPIPLSDEFLGTVQKIWLLY